MHYQTEVGDSFKDDGEEFFYEIVNTEGPISFILALNHMYLLIFNLYNCKNGNFVSFDLTQVGSLEERPGNHLYKGSISSYVTRLDRCIGQGSIGNQKPHQ